MAVSLMTLVLSTMRQSALFPEHLLARYADNATAVAALTGSFVAVAESNAAGELMKALGVDQVTRYSCACGIVYWVKNCGQVVEQQVCACKRMRGGMSAAFYQGTHNAERYPLVHLVLESCEELAVVSQLPPLLVWTNSIRKALNLQLERATAAKEPHSSTRGAVELDGAGAREQPRWTAATAAAHQPDALAKELRDFDQVYGSFVSEHPHPTNVPDYLAGPDGEVRPNKDFEAADWKEAWITGEVSPWAPQVGEVVLYYSSSYADKKAMPSIAQGSGDTGLAASALLVASQHSSAGTLWTSGGHHRKITMLVEVECSFDGQARLRDIRNGYGGVLVCSGPGDSSAHGRLRADGDHARAITGGASLTAVACEGGSANRGTTPTTRNCDIASTVIGGDADSSAQASMISIGGDGAELRVDGGGRVGDARQTSVPTTTVPAAADARVLATPQSAACVSAKVQAGATAAQAGAMEAVAEHGVERTDSAGGEFASGIQSAAERLAAAARSAATGDGLLIAVSASTSVSGSDAAELQSLSHVAIGEGIILAGLPVLRAYCTTWGHHADAMWGELLHPARRHQRFSRFRAQQAAIAKIAEKLAPIRLQYRPPGWKRVRSRGRRYPRRRRRHRRWRDTHRRPRRIIFFGACARFPSRGRAAIPIKKLAVEGGVAVIDRDTNARANLGGVYATCGVDDIIPGYVSADQEEEKDTEEEESDEEDDDEEDNEEEDSEEGGDGDEGGDGGGGASMTERAVNSGLVCLRALQGQPRKLEYQTDVVTSALVKGNLLFAACPHNEKCEDVDRLWIKHD
ncbi:hypothetical protein JKP88DRAFT_245973 [Tribonema minus]|uniref:Uncharacterized protein n=1 Tax=Tribonema minus TaxID=303371 RepID=A0A835YW69_9STRA|nr:hypothetical protein JKP88DRAFT_245973 [Tribonema minus]